MEVEGNSEIMETGDTSNNEIKIPEEDERTTEDQLVDDLSEVDDQSEEEDSELNSTDMEQDDDSDEDYEVEITDDDDSDYLGFDASMSIVCRHCSGKEFDNYSELCIHATEEHPLVCLFCFQSFNDRDALNKHQSKTNHTVWRCNICNEIFLKQSAYEKHVISLHYERCPYKCTICKKYGAFKEDDFNSHSRSCKIYAKRRNLFAFRTKICGTCYRTFGSYYSLILHMCKEHADRSYTHIYKCESCKIGFAEISKFKNHVTFWHPNDKKYLSNVDSLKEAIKRRSRTCVMCDLFIPSSFSRHMRNNHPNVFTHKCDKCESYFYEETDLDDHRVKNHGGNPLLCIYCNKTCRGMDGLRTHLNVAHGLLMPNFFCFMHNKGFANSSSLKQHMRSSHQDSRNSAIIEKTDRRKEYRKKSSRDSPSGQRYPCDTCGRIFDHKGSWEAHVIKHTEKYKCDNCFRTFESASNLSRHMVVHTGEKPYQCDLCGLSVSQKSALARHRKVVHSNGNLGRSRAITPRRTRGPAHQKLNLEDEYQALNASIVNVSTANP